MSWKAEYIVLIMFSTLVDYISALRMYKTKSMKVKKFFLGLSLCANLGLLFTFKYFNFVSDSLRQFLSLFSIPFSPPVLNVLLPVGISFYTFQTLSYTIDVYRGRIKPEKHLGIFAVYVSFFPQLIAGPIERAKNLLPQFFEKHHFDYTRVTDGLKLMLWGFFKKIVIADRLAIVVDAVYNNVGDHTGIPLILATVFFTFQVYCDFSGYSDIAIGGAQVMGIRLMDNFKRPFHSRSIAEFWRRWHISLSTWFRDYCFTPLYRHLSSHANLKNFSFNIRHWLSFVTASVIGLTLLGFWHGAYWTFGIFGLYHAIMLIAYYIVRKKWDRMNRYIQIFSTFGIVSFSFIVFRANTLSDAVYIVTHLFSGWTLNFAGINIGITWAELMLSFTLILFMQFIHILQEHMRMRQFLSDKPTWVRWSIYIVIIWALILFGIFGQKEFIYFQF